MQVTEKGTTAMSATAGSHSEQVRTVAGHDVQVRRGGAGKPLVYLHGELGLPGWVRTLELLGESFDVIAPSLPGFGTSARPDWIMTIDDLTNWLVSFVEDLDLTEAPVVVGSSLGGWLATHAAAVNRDLFDKVVLVNPCGVKPREGEIWDYYFEPTNVGYERAVIDHDAPEYVKYYTGWGPEQMEQAESDREMAVRLTWKPYMFGLTTEQRAKAIRTPTLVVVGEQDEIVPNDCGRILHEAIASSEFTAIRGGHLVEIENPDGLAEVIGKFAS
jgi:pimeloyl-ACP methyl ester carboxylesterase